MADGKLSEQQISPFHRLLQHLPKDNDLSLLVLKGHLLMEERLFDLLERSVRNPEYVKRANLRTGQLIAVVAGLHWSPDRAWVWHMAWGLNKLRNELSHRLESKDLTRLIDEFLKPVADRVPEGARFFGDSPAGRLRAGICFLHGALME